MFITDGDDQDTYDGMDWGTATHAVLDPRDYLTGKLNKTAEAMADLYPVLMWLGDDCVSGDARLGQDHARRPGRPRRHRAGCTPTTSAGTTSPSTGCAPPTW